MIAAPTTNTSVANVLPGSLTPPPTTAPTTPTTGPAVDLGPLLHQVGLAHAATVLPAWLDRAAREDLAYADFLQGLLGVDRVARQRNAVRVPQPTRRAAPQSRPLQCASRTAMRHLPNPARTGAPAEWEEPPVPLIVPG